MILLEGFWLLNLTKWCLQGKVSARKPLSCHQIFAEMENIFENWLIWLLFTITMAQDKY